jgi:hypothetical protein
MGVKANLLDDGIGRYQSIGRCDEWRPLQRYAHLFPAERLPSFISLVTLTMQDRSKKYVTRSSVFVLPLLTDYEILLW